MSMRPPPSLNEPGFMWDSLPSPFEGKAGESSQSSKSCRQGERAAGPPEDPAWRSNKAARGVRAQANVALSVRLDSC